MILKDWLDIKYTKEEQSNFISLDCSGEGISSLEGIEVLVNLKELYCYNNPLPYSDLKDLNKIKLEVKKEIRQEKIQKMLL